MEERETRIRRSLEIFLLVMLWLGAVALVGGAASLVLVGLLSPLGTSALLTMGLLATSASFLVSFNINVLRRTLRGVQGDRYEQLRRWTRIKTSSLFLSLMVLAATVVMAAALLGRLGIFEIDADAAVFSRLVSILLTALGIAIAYAHYQSLRVRLERARAGIVRAYHGLLLFVAVLFAAGGMYVASGRDLGPVSTADHPYLSLAALTVLGITVFITRGLPTPYNVLGRDPTGYKGHVHYDRRKAVTVPILIAFGLLFLLFFAFLAFGIGALQAVDAVLQDAVTLVVLLIFLVAVVVSLVGSFFLARQEDKPILYQRKRSREEKAMAITWAVSLTIAALITALAAAVGLQGGAFGIPEHRWVDILAVAIMVAVGPAGFAASRRARHNRQLEERMPDFLRDLASSHKGGLTLTASVYVASRGDYGALTADIQKMADQLSWNVAFEEALDRFGERVNTPLAKRTVSLILEASRSGGNTTDVLIAAGRDAREIKALEAQRRLSMSLYTAVIYITFLVFLVVVSILQAQFVPEVIRASEAAGAAGATGVQGIGVETPSAIEFRTFYFMAAIVQGVGDGVVAGLMGTGRAMQGLKHSFTMVLIALLTFVFIL